MKQKQITIAAVACGATCALCVAAFLWSVEGEANAARAEALARYGGEQIEICVATRDVAAGERVDASAIESRLWVADLLPESAVSQSDDVIGKTATSSILKGEVISEKRFAQTQGTLDIPPGFEAVSVPTKAVQAVGGAIRAGMSVDLYSLGNSGSSPLARGIIVLATSVAEGGGLVANDSGWVTLAVRPEQVEEIIAASGKTTLYFALPGAAPESAGSDSTASESEGIGGAPETGDGESGEGPALSEGAPEQDGAEGPTPQDDNETAPESQEGDEQR